MDARCVIRPGPRAGVFDIVVPREVLCDDGDVCGKRFLRQKVRGRETGYASSGWSWVNVLTLRFDRWFLPDDYDICRHFTSLVCRLD
jgi:hypothetical protein